MCAVGDTVGNPVRTVAYLKQKITEKSVKKKLTKATPIHFKCLNQFLKWPLEANSKSE